MMRSITGGPVHALLGYLREYLRADRDLVQLATPDEIVTGTYAAAPLAESDDGKISVYADKLPAICFSADTAAAKDYGGFDGIDLRGSLWYVFRTPQGAMQADGLPARGEALGLTWSLAVLLRILKALQAGQLVPSWGKPATWTYETGGIDSAAPAGPAALMVEGKDLVGFKLPISVTFWKPPYTVQAPAAANITTTTLTPYDDGTTVKGPDVVLTETTT